MPLTLVGERLAGGLRRCGPDIGTPMLCRGCVPCLDYCYPQLIFSSPFPVSITSLSLMLPPLVTGLRDRQRP